MRHYTKRRLKREKQVSPVVQHFSRNFWPCSMPILQNEERYSTSLRVLRLSIKLARRAVVFPHTARLFGLDVLRKSKARTLSQRDANAKVRCSVGSCWHLLHLKNNGLITRLSRPPCKRGTRGKPCRQRQGEQISYFLPIVRRCVPCSHSAVGVA